MMRTRQVSSANQVGATQVTVDHDHYIPLIILTFFRLSQSGCVYTQRAPCSGVILRTPIIDVLPDDGQFADGDRHKISDKPKDP
jgi:hypothetical protein